MKKTTKFKNMGIELEGDLIETQGNTHYIRTPFRGEVYAVDSSDIIKDIEEIGKHSVIFTNSVIGVEDWTQGISGESLIQWEHHTNLNEDGSVSSYVKIPNQKLLIDWTHEDEDQEDSFDSWIEICEMYEDDHIVLSNKTTKNIQPTRLVLDLGGSIKVEF